MALQKLPYSVLNTEISTPQEPYIDDVFDFLPIVGSRNVRSYLYDKYKLPVVAEIGGFVEGLNNAWTGQQGRFGPGMGLLSYFGRTMDKVADPGLAFASGVYNPFEIFENIYKKDMDYTGKDALSNVLNMVPGVNITPADMTGLGWNAASLGTELILDPGIFGTLLSKSAGKAGNIGLKNIGDALNNYDNFMAGIAANAAIPGITFAGKKLIKSLKQLVGSASFKNVEDIDLKAREGTGEVSPPKVKAKKPTVPPAQEFVEKISRQVQEQIETNFSPYTIKNDPNVNELYLDVLKTKPSNTTENLKNIKAAKESLETVTPVKYIDPKEVTSEVIIPPSKQLEIANELEIKRFAKGYENIKGVIDDTRIPTMTPEEATSKGVTRFKPKNVFRLDDRIEELYKIPSNENLEFVTDFRKALRSEFKVEDVEIADRLIKMFDDMVGVKEINVNGKFTTVYDPNLNRKLADTSKDLSIWEMVQNEGFELDVINKIQNAYQKINPSYIPEKTYVVRLTNYARFPKTKAVFNYMNKNFKEFLNKYFDPRAVTVNPLVLKNRLAKEIMPLEYLENLDNPEVLKILIKANPKYAKIDEFLNNVVNLIFTKDLDKPINSSFVYKSSDLNLKVGSIDAKLKEFFKTFDFDKLPYTLTSNKKASEFIEKPEKLYELLQQVPSLADDFISKITSVISDRTKDIPFLDTKQLKTLNNMLEEVVTNGDTKRLAEIVSSLNGLEQSFGTKIFNFNLEKSFNPVFKSDMIEDLNNILIELENLWKQSKDIEYASTSFLQRGLRESSDPLKVAYAMLDEYGPMIEIEELIGKEKITTKSYLERIGKMREKTINAGDLSGFTPKSPFESVIFDKNKVAKTEKLLTSEVPNIVKEVTPTKVPKGTIYEVSSKGDSRFSALKAKLKDGRTIEEAYQLDIKGYRKLGNDWRLGKGKPPLLKYTTEEGYKQYKKLWETYLNENPELLKELTEKIQQGYVLKDSFAKTKVNQASVLQELVEENINKIKEIEPLPKLEPLEKVINKAEEPVTIALQNEVVNKVAQEFNVIEKPLLLTPNVQPNLSKINVQNALEDSTINALKNEPVGSQGRRLFQLIDEAMTNFKDVATGRKLGVYHVIGDKLKAFEEFVDDKMFKSNGKYLKTTAKRVIEYIDDLQPYYVKKENIIQNFIESGGLKYTRVDKGSKEYSRLKTYFTKIAASAKQITGHDIIKIIDKEVNGAVFIGMKLDTNYPKVQNYLSDLVKKEIDKTLNLDVDEINYFFKPKNIKNLTGDEIELYNKYQEILDNVKDYYTKAGYGADISDEFIHHTLKSGAEEFSVPSFRQIYGEIDEFNPAIAKEVSEKVIDFNHMKKSFQSTTNRRSFEGPMRLINEPFLAPSGDSLVFENIDLRKIIRSSLGSGVLNNKNYQTFISTVLNDNFKIKNNFYNVDHLKKALQPEGNLSNFEILSPVYDDTGRIIKLKRYDKLNEKALTQAFGMDDTVMLPTVVMSAFDRILKKEVLMSNNFYKFINSYFTIPFKFGVLGNLGFLFGNINDAFFKSTMIDSIKYNKGFIRSVIDFSKTLGEVMSVNEKFSEIYESYLKDANQRIPMEVTLTNGKEYAKFSSWVNGVLADPITKEIRNTRILNAEEVKLVSLFTNLNVFQSSKMTTELQDLGTKAASELQNRLMQKSAFGDMYMVDDPSIIKNLLYGFRLKDGKQVPGLFLNNPISNSVLKTSNIIENWMRSASVLSELKAKGIIKNETLSLATSALGETGHVELLNALNKMNATHFSYDNVTEFMNKASTVIPFPTFYAKNIALWLEMFADNPQAVEAILDTQKNLWGDRDFAGEKDTFAVEAMGRGAIPGPGKTFIKPTPQASLFSAFGNINEPIQNLAFRTNPLLRIPASLAMDSENVKYRPYSTNLFEKNIKKGDPNFNLLRYQLQSMNPYERTIQNLLRMPNKIKEGKAGLADVVPSVFQPDFSKPKK
jgi:hypothetical protein